MKSKRTIRAMLFLLVIVIVFGLSACGNQGTSNDNTEVPTSEPEKADNSEEPKAEDTKPNPTTNKIPEEDQFFANLEPQVIYDENNVKITLEVAPDKQVRTYQVTIENGMDKTIEVKLNYFVVEGVRVRMSLVGKTSQIWIKHISPGETVVTEVSLTNLEDLHEYNLYKDSGLGNLGDFETTITLVDDELNQLTEPKVVSIKTERGPTKPDLSVVTKNMLVDQEGIKLSLTRVFTNEMNYRFIFFYENPHENAVDMQSTTVNADGLVIHEGTMGMFFSMPPKSKGFYQHVSSKFLDAGVTELKNVEAKFKFTDYQGLEFETDLIPFNLDQFPPIKE
jgi:hypothetical protein